MTPCGGGTPRMYPRPHLPPCHTGGGGRYEHSYSTHARTHTPGEPSPLGLAGMNERLPVCMSCLSTACLLAHSLVFPSHIPSCLFCLSASLFPSPPLLKSKTRFYFRPMSGNHCASRINEQKSRTPQRPRLFVCGNVFAAYRYVGDIGVPNR
ncbi:hypothetical protein LZ31DRAFT_331061 [Colletotrichum somersetense]|nr:hypothetical protein LZ31DRAFT_331061 [Colletotrichum somersetense]